MGPCMCGDPCCSSCGPAQGYPVGYDGEEYCIASFERFALDMDYDDALQCSHQGECVDDVTTVLCKPYIVRQLDAIGDADIADELAATGGWDDIELSSAQMNRARIVWLAACQIREEADEQQRAEARRA